MKQIVTKIANDTFGRYYALAKSNLIQLDRNKNNNIPKFYSQHNKDKYWDSRACAIACVKMILNSNENKASLKKLIKIGLKYNGYDQQNDIGWYHESLVKILGEFNIKAKTKKYVSANEIAKIIYKNNYVIASIESKMGGHLILIYDYKLDTNKNLKHLIYHDPWYVKYGAEKRISKAKFDKISKRRIIVVNKLNE